MVESNKEPRTLLVYAHPRNFRITIPAEAKVTFGPWSPGEKGGGYGDKAMQGTLRIYEKGEKSTILGVFSGVTSFRDISSLQYAEEVAKEEGATIWKSDENGYEREEKVSRSTEWVVPNLLGSTTNGIEEEAE